MRRQRTSRAERKRATRSDLREASARLCAKKGFLQLRTLDVARAAGVSHGAVFTHFPSRDALIVSTVDLVGRRLTDRLHDLGRAKAGLRESLEAYLAVIGEHEAIYARLVTESSHLPARARRAWIGVQSAICHHLASVVEHETERGTIRPMPLHLFFNTWTGLVNHYLSQRDLFAPGESVIRRCGEELLVHFLDLVSTK